MSDQSKFFVRRQGRVEGPWLIAKLRSEVQLRKLGRYHEVSEDGKTWRRASEVDGLFEKTVVRKTIGGATAEAPINDPVSQPKPAEEVVWYCVIDDDQDGPMTLVDLGKLIADGHVMLNDLVWREGYADWLPAEDVPELASFLRSERTSSCGARTEATRLVQRPLPNAASQPAMYSAILAGIIAIPSCLPIVGLLGIVPAIMGGGCCSSNSREERGGHALRNYWAFIGNYRATLGDGDTVRHDCRNNIFLHKELTTLENRVMNGNASMDIPLAWARCDIEQRLMFRGAKHTGVNSLLSALLGLLLSIVFYGALIPLQNTYFASMFLKPWPDSVVPCSIVFFSTWCASILFIKAEQQALAELEKQIKEMQSQLDEINSSNQMFFTEGIQGKATWVVEITSAGFAAAKIGVKAPPRSFGSVAAFAQWIEALPPSSTAFYLIVKPSGVTHFENVRESIHNKGFEFGFDLIPNGKRVVDPQNGVSAP